VPRVPQNVRQIIVVDDTAFLALGAVPHRDGYSMLTLMTEHGSVLWQKVPAPPVLAATRLVSDGVRGTRTRDGHVVVGHGISPEFTKISASTGAAVCTGTLPASRWTQLDAANRPNGSLPVTREWIEQSSVVHSGHALNDGKVLVATERGLAGGAFENDWIVIRTDLTPELRALNVPGRLLLVRGDSAWLTGETDDGHVTLTRVPLVFTPTRK
jgi:hypothetical protein